MEMEQINDNTIRVLIDNDDLEERGITVLDLLGSQNQIEAFFYSILEEVDIDDSFKKNDMITFQVVPNKAGLELYISKDNNIDPAIFTRARETSAKNSKVSGSTVAGEGRMLNDYFDDSKQESVFSFDDFEDVIEFAKHVYLSDGISYLHLLDKVYYITLVQFSDQMSDSQRDLERATALEFGEESRFSLDYVHEHAEELIQANALQTLRQYFK